MFTYLSLYFSLTFCFAVLVSAIGAISFRFSSRKNSYFVMWLIYTVVYALGLFHLNIWWKCPFEIWRILLLIICMLGITNIVDYFFEETDRHYERKKGLFYIGCALLLTGLSLTVLGDTDFSIATDLYKMVEKDRVDVKEFSDDPIDEAHIPVVPKATAMRIARQTISKDGKNYGAFYCFEPDTMTQQKFNNHIYWVAPMEFGGFWKQGKIEHSPGFVMISRENPEEKPRSVTKKADGTLIRYKYMVHS